MENDHEIDAKADRILSEERETCLKRRIGQIGLGALGLPFARRLHAAFGGLHVLDLKAARINLARKFGATVARSPRDLAARCDVILLSLPNPLAVRAVMEGPKGVLAGAMQGTIVIDTSTVDPSTSEAMHRVSAVRKIGYLDAPVSSGEPGFAGVEAARSGTFTFLVGGRKADFESVHPILKTLGKRIQYLGPAGSGSVMKLISNHIAGITTWAVAEGIALAAACGVPALKAIDVLEGTVAASYVMTDDVRPRVESGDFEPGFSVDLYHKDLRLTGELARALSVPVIFNQLAMEMFQFMRAQGRGGKSQMDCVNYMAELARVDIHKPPSRAQRLRKVGHRG
jgi:3-hydroxyisobutyrate dehydrogenase-like beta-hydroxyacid dehydrogenase